MKKILIAYDGTPGAEAAMLDTKRAGLPERCEATVLSIADVWLPPEQGAGEPPLPDPIAESRARARQHAAGILAAGRQTATRGAERLRGLFPHWNIIATANADSPAWGILSEARRWGAEIIVIGSHGHSPLHKFFLGSVSNKVAAEAHCSVRVYREDRKRAGYKDGPLRIVIALDGSDDATGAFLELLSREWPSNAEFHLVTVVDARVQAAAIMEAGIVLPEPAPEGANDWIQPMLEERAEELKKRGLEASTHVLEGDPKSALLDHAENWNADCIFVGARGLHHGRRLYLGTFASAIATRAHCSVEIIRPKADGLTANSPV